MPKVILIVLILNFSIVNAKSPFDSHKNQIKSLNTIYVLTDTMVVDDMKGSDVGLETEYNFILGRKLFKNLEYLLESSISADFVHIINSVGLYEKDNVYLLDTKDLATKIILPQIDEEVKIENQESFLKELNPLADRSFDMTRPSRMHKKYQIKMLDKDFSRISRVGLHEGEAVLMLLTSGIKVPGKKTAGKAALVGLLTLGMYVPIEMSATNFNVVLFDHKGQLLWAGKSLKAGKGDKDKKQLKLLKKSFKGFPLKLKKIPKK